MNPNEPERQLLFLEVQRFRQPWLWVIVLTPTIFVTGVVVYTLVTGEQFGEKPAPLPVLVAMVLLMALVVIGFARAGLTTVIDEEGMNYGWNLFGPKLNRFRWRDVQTLRLIRYRFVGYGIRSSRQHGTIHNVSGRIGLQIETKKGGKLMIGTRGPEELDSAVRTIVDRHPHIIYSNTLVRQTAG